jgi:SAM-dependent methyltransferase
VIADRERWQERHRAPAERAAPSPFVVAHVARCAAGRPGRRALDLACGAGRHTALLARYGFRTVALDQASQAVVRLPAEIPGVCCVVADARSLPLRATSFTLIVQTLFLERSALAATLELLEPGGVLVVETFLVAQHDATGHPRREFCLHPGELVQLCTAGGAARVLETREGAVERSGKIVHLASLAACKV